MKKGFRWYDSIFILIFIYLFVIQIQAIWSFTIDDMYISLRYAKHWVEGNGLLWNLNAPPVEGYSNFSFVVLGALSLILKGDPVIVLKAAGVTGLFTTCCFVYLITRFWFEKRQSLIPCIGLLLYKGQIIWAVSGLETTVYQTLISGSVYFAFRGLGYRFFPELRGKSEPIFFFLSGLFLAFSGMTRPEAPVLMATFFILMCWDRPDSDRKDYRQGMIVFMLPLLLIFLPYFLWRWHYFGFLFPNPVYCKGFANDTTILDIEYLKLIWPFAIAALFACIKTQDKRYYFLWLPSLLYLLMLLGSEPLVAFDNRLFLTSFVLLLPLSLKGMSDIVLIYSKQRNEVYNCVFSIFLIFMGWFFIPSASVSDYKYFKLNPVRGEQLRSQVLQWLNAHTKKGDSVVLSDAGYIPYYSDLNFIDSYCLNNISMTQYPKSQMYEQFCHNVILEKPEVFILTSLTKPEKVLYAPSDFCLKTLLQNGNEYKLTRIFYVDDQNKRYSYELYSKL